MSRFCDSGILDIHADSIGTMRKLLEKTQSYLSAERTQFIQGAYEFAAKAHDGQTRLSGEPFLDHPLETARYLADLHLDAPTLAGALLHDVMEDCGVSFEELEQQFGAEVATLVDAVTKLGRMDKQDAQEHDGAALDLDDGHYKAASLRKMLVSMAKDVRVVLIKLADRLHNMRTLKAHAPERQIAIAQETLDIYAPLAHRLGIWDFKWRLEDMAFRYLQPTQYKYISRLLASRREEREQYTTHMCDVLAEGLTKASIEAQVTGRAKHIYSIYKKMQTYNAQGKAFHDIYDLFALRVLVQEKQDCYATLGIVHSLWHPLPGQFDDYIAKPKENMYQGLHTAVMGPEAKPLEVQIKTHAMHEVAEYGVASHWVYKEGDSVKDTQFEEKMTWLRQVLEWQQEVSESEEFLETIKTDLFPDQVFVYTPKGDIKELPAGATPIDMAYRIHTELGHRCIGAKVNGKLTTLDYPLQSGDTVEILTSKVARGPSLDWLNSNLGYVRSGNAREKIRTWFRKQERGANIERGKELLAKEFLRLSVAPDHAEVAKLFQYDSLDDLFAALGSGSLTTNQIAARLTLLQERSPEELQTQVYGPASGIQIRGVGNLLPHLARCCSPIPGDEIIGYITRTRGIAVHRKSCRNIIKGDEPDRLVNVDWGTTRNLYPVRLCIEAWDRVGLLRDITALVSGDQVNIASMVTQEDSQEGTATIFLTLFTQGIDQLSRLFVILEGVPGVINVTRTELGESAPTEKSTAGGESEPKRSIHAQRKNGAKSGKTIQP